MNDRWRGRAASVLSLALLLEACRSMARVHQPSEAAQIVVGTTTQSEVLDQVGLPNRTERIEGDDSRPVDRWTYFCGADWTSVTWMTKGGATIHIVNDRGHARGKDVALMIDFTEEGVVAAVAAGREKP